MEAKLQSLKVPELKALLTQASLPATGVKADLIARLVANPQATASLNGGSEETANKPTQQPATPAAPAATPAAAPKVQNPTPAQTSKTTAAAAESAPAQPTEATQPTEPEQSEEERRQVLIAELEKRKARAAKFGQPLGEAEAKLERLIKFGIDATEEAAVAKLAKPLGTKKSRGGRESKPQEQQKKETPSIPSKPQETESEKADRLAKMEIEKEKARKRAERFGLPTPAPAATASSNPEDEEKKRKRDEKFAADKKVKT